MFERPLHPARLNRRRLFRLAGGAASFAALGAVAAPSSASSATEISVLSPLPPDPAPPGVGGYGKDDLARWQSQHNAWLNYEAVAWSNLHDKLANTFAAGLHIYDALYLSGWAPEFAKRLTPLEERLPRNLRADLPKSAFNTVSWNGHVYAVTTTLSLLTLYVNSEHLRDAGIAAPPATWDELKGIAHALTNGERYGWRLNYGASGGIGGIASYWMTFLQQAGGKMYGTNGRPVFDDTPGVDALQLMIDLLPSTDPRSFTDTSIVDTTVGVRAGDVSITFGWPFMWSTLQDDPRSPTAGQFATALLPAGAAGSASLDGSDAWAIAADSKIAELAMDWIDFYLDKEIQKQQALKTGWLPIRTSVYADDEITAALPHAATVLEQSKHPYDSFVTPEYAEVTTAIGDEIVQALRGLKTAAKAISDASAVVSSIVSERLGS
jgi:multiple sugar transport system substrate-binding protein